MEQRIVEIARRHLCTIALGFICSPICAKQLTAAHAPSVPFRDLAAARRVGQRYLLQHPGERFVVSGLIRNGDPSHDLSRHDAMDRMIERIREDFRRSDTVTIDGWILARTEARLCAWAALA